MAWHSDYTNRYKVTIDPTKVGSTLTDFPVCLKLGAATGQTGVDTSGIIDGLKTPPDNPYTWTGADGTPADTDYWDSVNPDGRGTAEVYNNTWRYYSNNTIKFR